MSFLSSVERVFDRESDERSLRVSLLEVLRTALPHDFYAWLLTDPETCVGSAPVAEIPELDDLPSLIRLKYLTVTNRWTGLAPGVPMTLATATGGDRSQSRLWSELLAGYGIDDVASIAFRDQYGCWGFLDLWRRDGTFSVEECALLQHFGELATPHVRRSLGSTFEREASTPAPSKGPAVLLLTNEIELLTQTPSICA